MKFTLAALALIGATSAEFVDTPYGGVYIMTSAQRESDHIANADKADDKEVEDEFDPDDPVVDDSGFVHKWVQTSQQINMGNLIQLQQRQRSPATGDSTFKSGQKVYDSSYQPTKYSQELANGDSADDRDIHEDEDMKDDVVDYMGQTNAGYGSRNMEWFHAHNTIDESAGPGHFLTDPGF